MSLAKIKQLDRMKAPINKIGIAKFIKIKKQAKGNPMTKKQFLKWRKDMGITQAQAANLLGYKNKSMIARFEGGFAPINARVEMLCKMFKETN